MRNVRRAILTLLLLVVGFIVVLFMLENQQMVSLRLLGWIAPEVPVSAFLLLALLTGLAISPLLVWLRGNRRR
jgi:putative membrane protein